MNFESFLEATEHDEGGKGIVVTYNNHITETQHDLSKVLDLSILHEE